MIQNRIITHLVESTSTYWMDFLLELSLHHSLRQLYNLRGGGLIDVFIPFLKHEQLTLSVTWVGPCCGFGSVFFGFFCTLLKHCSFWFIHHTFKLLLITVSWFWYSRPIYTRSAQKTFTASFTSSVWEIKKGSNNDKNGSTFKKKKEKKTNNSVNKLLHFAICWIYDENLPGSSHDMIQSKLIHSILFTTK